MATRRRSQATQPSDDPISTESLERTANAMDALADRALQSSGDESQRDLIAPMHARAESIKECAAGIRKAIDECFVVTTLMEYLKKRQAEGQTPSRRTSTRRPRGAKSDTGHNPGEGGEGNPDAGKGGGGPSFDGLSQ